MPVACGDAGFLSGTGGEGEEVPPPSEEAAPSEEPEGVENPENTLNPAYSANFYSPSLVIILTDDNEYKTEISIPPMGTAEYQVTAPNILQVGEESYIELILVPHTFTINKDQFFNNKDLGIFQLFQGDIDIYPRLKAELITGNSFSFGPYSSLDKLILLDKPATWIWYITALKPGEHKLSVNISVPVSNAGTTEDFPLETIEFYINILSPTPTPTNTSTPIPTSTPTPTSTPIPTITPIPSFGAQISGSAAPITIAIIGALGTILATAIGTVLGLEKIKKKKAEKKRELDSIESKRKEQEFKEGLRKPKKPK